MHRCRGSFEYFGDDYYVPQESNNTTARSNNSIALISKLRPWTKSNALNVADIGQAVDWLFNSTAAGLPTISSIVYQFWALGAGTKHP